VPIFIPVLKLINPGEHGLSSAAIVGGVGDNGRGITGVNWDLELMLFSFTKISDLVKSYDYVIDQREKFNNSNGTEGAFVVATSNSFGQNRVFCESKPVWAAMFDELGAVGVLSSYGVGNVRYDADVAGDMPASCPSDYLLISCNTDEDDNLFSSSAYGAVSVDLGAPGEGTVTARPNNTYGVFGGNSAATPHVSGAIALLYAGDCAQLETDARQAPAATALRIKDLLLQSAEQRPSLQNRTLTGGRLHVGDAMNLLTESCNNTLGELAILRLGPNPTDDLLRINYQVPENGTYELELFDALGRRCQHQQVEVNTFGIRRLDWDVSRLVAGVYWLRFGDGGAGVWKQVVVI
ncbi:MAG: S8 family serine peptidase, partial [Bacteroidota bacterium]